MKVVSIDASKFHNSLEFFQALKEAIGGPEWHGLSIDAFLDTMVWHDVNALTPPYTVVVFNSNTAPYEVREDALLLKRCILDARRELKRLRGVDREVDLVVK